MPETLSTDLVVLGGGPGGYAAAFLAADRGIATTLIDAMPKPGGTCLHVGCIPSKALLHAAKLIHAARDAGRLRHQVRQARRSTSTAPRQGGQDRRHDDQQPRSSWPRIAASRIIVGRGSFVDAHTIQVDGGPTVKFQNCIIATGSIPAKLPTFDIEQHAHHGFDRGAAARQTCRRRCSSSAAATSAWSWAPSTRPSAARSPSSK